MIDNNILAEYLKRKGSEVRNMLVAEYNYEKDIAVKQEEAREEGREKGREEGELKKAKKTALNMIKKGYSIPVIADLLEVRDNIVKDWILENNINKTS